MSGPHRLLARPAPRAPAVRIDRPWPGRRGPLALALGAVLLGACASQPAQVRPAPDPAAAPSEPAALTLEQARELVADFEARLPYDPAEPLLHPTSLDDALAILRLDQVKLFGAGVAYCAGLDTLEAVAMRGQLELAWGEAYVVLVEVLSDLQQRLDRDARELEYQAAARALQAEEQARLARLRDNVASLRRSAAAFKLLAIEHITDGVRAAEQVIAAHPDSYLGYRVAADYHRMARDWESFEVLVEQIRAINPDSNGLVFLLGSAAYLRDADVATASGHLRAALARDPQFARAQAHLLMIQPDVTAMHRELQELARRSPRHQLISWAGPAIEEAFAQLRARHDQEAAPSP